jgi:hypothetical protein
MTDAHRLTDDAVRVPTVARRMGDAAQRWLDTLTDAQRKVARFPFGTDERYVWNYRPVSHEGLALQEMSAPQRDAASALLDAGLSARGADEARAIMALEPILGEIERLAGRDNWVRRNPLLYWFAVFGEPGKRDPWSWRVGGHHVAVHVTVVDADFVAVTPLFFGTNPATVPHGPHAGLRTLGAEEDLARALLAQLRGDQKAIAIVDPVAPADILTTNYRSADPNSIARGVAYEQLDAGQREGLARLVRHYVERSAPEIALAEWRRIEAAGLERVTFAWAGPEARGQGHYYAVRGPRFLIEYDNTQNDANHIHAVWRDFTNDWGEDLLAAHYAQSHGRHGSR